MPLTRLLFAALLLCAPASPETRTIRCWTGEGTKPADDCTAQLKAAMKKGWRLVDVWHKHEKTLVWYEFELERPEKEKRR